MIYIVSKCGYSTFTPPWGFHGKTLLILAKIPEKIEMKF